MLKSELWANKVRMRAQKKKNMLLPFTLQSYFLLLLFCHGATWQCHVFCWNAHWEELTAFVKIATKGPRIRQQNRREQLPNPAETTLCMSQVYQKKKCYFFFLIFFF